jgi:hypothetical protein
MRLRKVVNRAHKGTTYYRWLLSIPPRDIRRLGWVHGQELRTVVRGTVLSVEPVLGTPTPQRIGELAAIEDSIRRRSLVTRRS